ncbi:MAG: hypothetical protein ABI569_17410 [Casimicrobiaceae bacterium]
MPNEQRKTVSPRIARMLRELEGPPSAIPLRVARDDRRTAPLTGDPPRGLIPTA